MATTWWCTVEVVDDTVNDQLVGSNVQKYRTAMGLSQADLAAAISDGDEHVHQQTIQKIEKGTRSLKYAEAVKICRALMIGPAQLSDGSGHTTANARYLQHATALSQMATELGEFADRLSSVLVNLAELIALERSDKEENQATARIADGTARWLHTDWGKYLNERILDSLRVHRHLASLHSDLDAPTYAEVLQRVSHSVRAFQPGVDHIEAGYDASET